MTASSAQKIGPLAVLTLTTNTPQHVIEDTVFQKRYANIESLNQALTQAVANFPMQEVRAAIDEWPICEKIIFFFLRHEMCVTEFMSLLAVNIRGANCKHNTARYISTSVKSSSFYGLENFHYFRFCNISNIYNHISDIFYIFAFLFFLMVKLMKTCDGTVRKLMQFSCFMLTRFFYSEIPFLLK